jgi:NAD(P)-dependent dehydrogenase (short-subunit alcohol dehydrogenase family)
MTLDDWHAVLAANVTGMFVCAGVAVRHMVTGTSINLFRS